MSLIKRQDGVNFAINSYREVIPVKKTSLLKKEFHLLSNAHGKFAKLYYKDEKKSVECIFSQEQGYLLGSAVWRHFGHKSENMIFCEDLPNTQDALLVIIYNNLVYLETQLPKSHIITELASLLLLGEKIKFDIYIHGDVPIAETTTEGKFAFEKNMVNSFEVMEKPLFPTLEVTQQSLLLPIEDAIKELNLPSSYTVPILIGIIVLITGGYVWNKLHPREQIEVPQIVVAPVLEPYQRIQNALSTPAPDLVIIQLCNRADHFSTIPGWIPNTFSYNNTDKLITITVTPITGSASFSALMRWALRAGYRIEPTSSGATLTQPMPLPNRIIEQIGFPYALETYSNMYDQLSTLFPYQHLSLKETKNVSGYNELTLDIRLQTASTMLVRQLMPIFRNQPVTINSVNFTLQQGTLTGSINLSILGT